MCPDVCVHLCVCVCLCVSQAAELSIKFLSGDRAMEVILAVGPRLTQLRKFNAVGQRARTSTHTRRVLARTCLVSTRAFFSLCWRVSGC